MASSHGESTMKAQIRGGMMADLEATRRDAHQRTYEYRSKRRHASRTAIPTMLSRSSFIAALLLYCLVSHRTSGTNGTNGTNGRSISSATSWLLPGANALLLGQRGPTNQSTRRSSTGNLPITFDVRKSDRAFMSFASRKADQSDWSPMRLAASAQDSGTEEDDAPSSLAEAEGINGATDADTKQLGSSPAVDEPRPTESSQSLASSQSSTSSPPAVIVLNVNARQVTTDLVPMCQEILGAENVYLTTSNEEAKIAAAKIVQRNPKVVIPVGGDGTLTAIINHLTTAIQQSSASSASSSLNEYVSTETALRQMPFIGYIPLGTGNGAGSVAGAVAPLHGDKPSKLRRIRNLFRSKRRQLATTIKRLRQIGESMQTSILEEQAVLDCDIVDLHVMQVTTTTTTQTENDAAENEASPNDSTSNNSNNNPTATQTVTNEMQELAFFAGVGFDSLMLQDFKDIQRWTRQRKRLLPGFVKKSLSSVGGYCVALVTRTLPKCIARQAHEIQVEITTLSPQTAVWIDHRRGDVARRVGNAYSHGTESQTSSSVAGTSTQSSRSSSPPTLLYKGKAGIVAAGTAPYYGGGLRLFPFACLHPQRLHLRIGRIHPLRGFWNIPRIFAGTYRDMRDESFGCVDVIGSEMTVQVSGNNSQGYPLQHSGESVGMVRSFHLEVVKEPVRFVTLLPQRPIDESAL